ncbi:SDR family oxidoreductase [Candidatus Woesearchaeota archaeon]|nr:SDR family oxidoreductase [Candidatus Woesearchaeota archaeon]
MAKQKNKAKASKDAKKAVVTGAAGFIGSHVVELLLSKGFKVLGIDSMANGQLDNVELFQNNPNYEFHTIELAGQFNEKLFKDATYVFHLAALADIVPSIEEPFKYHQANVTATIRVLEACRKYCPSLKKFVYSASSSCYGIPDKYPTNEVAEVRPEYPYAFTKHVGEEYVLFWGKLYGLPVISLRFFNVYGPRARSNTTYGAVFKVFLSQKLHNKPLTIVGDGKQTRDFTFVTDIAKACFKAAESEVTDEIINIATGKPQSINYLAELIGGKSYPKEHLPKRPGEPDSTHGDITKAKKLLKWEPEVSFEEGVKIMLKNIEYWRSVPVWDKESIEKATKSWFKYLGKDKEE